MRALIASPWAGGEAIELGSDLWRKKLLPLGSVDYKGRTLVFDRAYLDGLADAYNSGAYDQVAFQIADGDNKHTNDPERYRGEVVSMDAEADGLYVTVKTTEAGNELLQMNPRLGISARIIEDYARSDGRHWPAAIQHVLGTLDPRIPALGQWEPVEMSADDSPDVIVDLSSAHFAGDDDAPAPGGDLGNEDLISVLAEYLEPDELEVYAEHGEEALLEYLEAKHAASQPQVSDPATASLAPSLNGDGTQFANDDLAGAIELAAAQATLRQAEDAARPVRRATGTDITEDRLATALDRLQRGTYLPGTAERALGFAADDGYAAGDAGCSCGATAPDGSTAAAHHLAGCDAATVALSPDDWAAAEMGLFQGWATETATDADGYSWTDQYGRPMSMTGLLESATGQRLTRDDPFQGLGRNREVLQAQRVPVWGDPDDQDGGQEFPGSTRQAARELASAMGLATRSAAEIRDTAAGQLALRGRAPRPTTISAAMDLYGETSRERAGRLKGGGVYPVPYGDEPLHGSQPVYSYRAA
jgi:hypothetical protein